MEEDHAISTMNRLEIPDVGPVFECGKPEKPLVILLHGFMQSAKSWRRIALDLKDFHVLAPDLLGHGFRGFSEGENLDLDAYVEQLKCLVEWAKNNYSPAGTSGISLVGYSMGGRIAASFAHRHPDLIQALVLESAGLGPRDEQERASREEKTARMVARLDASVAANPTRPLEDFIDFWQELPLFDTQRELPKEKQAALRAERLANDPSALRANLLQAGQHKMPNLRKALFEANVPLLYVVGERDVAYTKIARTLMHDWAEFLAENEGDPHASFQVTVIPEAGHNTHLERPDRFISVMSEFLRQQEGKGGCEHLAHFDLTNL